MLKITIVQDADELAEIYPAHVDADTDEFDHPIGVQADASFIPFAVGESTDARMCLGCVMDELDVMGADRL